VFDDLCESQAGVVTTAQALANGFTPGMIRSRVASGRWRRLNQRIYVTFNGRMPRMTAVWAGLLTAGEGAVLSHYTAAELAGLIDDRRSAIHVSIPAQRRVTRTPNLIVHHSSRLDGARHPARTPPQTRVEETTLDLAELAKTPDTVVALLSAACGRRLSTPDKIVAALANRPRFRWRELAGDALGDAADGAHSALERKYLRDVERLHGLPRASRQSRVVGADGHAVYRDVRYTAEGVTVELDGLVAHPADLRPRDMWRDNASSLRGDLVLHYGWGDVMARKCATASQVAEVLRMRGWTGMPKPCGPSCVIR
jgi:hypothetical protein